MNYEDILNALQADRRYRRHLDWGRPRKGHPEGTIRAHIEELEANLQQLRPVLSEEESQKLRILIHVHDTFKPDAKPGAAIAHPESHASLARSFLAEFCADEDLLAMVQYHDEPYALWRQRKFKGHYDFERFQQLLERIGNWDLFHAFLIVDGCTAGKSRESLEWWFAEVEGKVESRFVTRI